MKTVLVIDDEPEIRSLLQRVLEGAGYAVLLAAEGSEGMDVCATHSVDLVITDLIMPGQEGVETIMRLRSEYPNIQIIAISGGGRISGTRDFLNTARLLGAHRILAKPFPPNDILDIVAELLANK